MKFLLNDPISYDEIWQAVRAYIQENQGYKQPAYILIHPETRHKLIVKEIDESRGMSHRIVYHTLPSIEQGLRTDTKIFDLWIIRSEDVEPGFMILCG